MLIVVCLDVEAIATLEAFTHQLGHVTHIADHTEAGVVAGEYKSNRLCRIVRNSKRVDGKLTQ